MKVSKDVRTFVLFYLLLPRAVLHAHVACGFGGTSAIFLDMRFSHVRFKPFKQIFLNPDKNKI